MKNKLLLSFTILWACLYVNADSPDTLALTPPMGWNSWNCFSCDINEQQIKNVADLIVSSGMKDAGYKYVNVDDCWQVGRDRNGNILVDSLRFPSGIKALADYIHSKGLKFGIYSCAGSLTCAGRPGSRGYQYQDARTYAQWGVDYLKYDWCYEEAQTPQGAYRTMSDALKASGRSIVFSICEWGNSQPWKWAKGIGHLWRTTGDIINAFKGTMYGGGSGVVEIIDQNADLYPYAGPGHWNDPDMLQVGNGVLTMDENRSHFTMWCMLAAPLLAGNDLRSMDKETLSILTNKDVLAVDQDELGMQGRRYMKIGEHEVWVKQLKNGEAAVCFFNRSEQPWKLSYKFEKENYSFADIRFWELEYDVRDLWKGKYIGTSKDNLKQEIPIHGVLLLKLIPKRRN
nr:glycoside hydrolase family 27 protein [uncultured Bacteroides sp.]